MPSSKQLGLALIGSFMGLLWAIAVYMISMGLQDFDPFFPANLPYETQIIVVLLGLLIVVSPLAIIKGSYLAED